MHQNLKLRDLTSGQALRNYRRNLARSAFKTKAVLTSKFKLELSQDCDFLSDAVGFEKFQHLYDVVEGCKKGSLAYFLLSVILSGFRIFGTASEASLFAQRKAYGEEAFKSALAEAVGAALPNFTIAKLLKRLKTEVRARGGKDNRFVPEVIVKEYRKDLCSSLPKQANEEYVEQLLQEIARQLTVRFHSWQELKDNQEEVCAAVDVALSGFADFPKLHDMVKKASAQQQLPSGSTIVFDDSLPFIELKSDNEDIAPYAAASIILSYPEKKEDEKSPAFVSAHLTTATASGLSWLFNKGIKLFKEKNLEELLAIFSVPEAAQARIEQIREAALAIPEQQSFFCGEKSFGYHEFRSAFAGRIDSWMTNYIKRLAELKDILDCLDEAPVLPDFTCDGKDFLKAVDVDRNEVELLCSAYAGKRKQALESISNLLGKNACSTAQDIRCVEECSLLTNRLFAVREQIINALRQAQEDNLSIWKNLYAEVKDDFDAWNKLQRLPKLNQMSGGVPNANALLEETMIRFKFILQAQNEHYETIMSWAESSGIRIDVLDAVATEERSRLQKRKGLQDNAEELGLRRVLQRVAGLVRNRHDACAEAVRQWFEAEGVFADRKDFNKFFCNHLGNIYVSPFSRGCHQGYALKQGIIENRSRLWTSLLEFMHVHENDYVPFSEAFETFLRLKSLLMGMHLSALPKPVPSDIAVLRLDEKTISESVPEGLRLLLKQPLVSPSVLARAFNIYSSCLSGTMIILRRKRFFLRTKFLWVDNNSLVYVPKDKDWKLPKQRYAGSSLWQKILQSGVIVWKNNETVDVCATFDKAASAFASDAEHLRELFHQLPHDWCYELPVRLDAESSHPKKEKICAALIVKKKGTRGMEIKKGKVSSRVLARLVGPSSFKERLNQILLDPRSVIGDMTLLADQEVEQNLQKDRAELVNKKLELSLAIPLTTPEEEVDAAAANESPFKRIVAIDQGEAGFSYSVFNLSEAGNAQAEPLATGTVRIPSIRRLIKKVRSYRKEKQAVQKFNQKFDSTMFNLRENVAGDVCGAIAGLMSRYKAIPVLERQVGNLESGGKQLELVYKMVNARFVADAVQAHQTERSNWWYGAFNWSVPGLMREISQEITAAQKNKKAVVQKNGKFYKPLNVGPGVAVNARWTSRICSHCGTNIFELIERAKEDKISNVKTNEHGELELYGKTFRLCRRPSAQESKRARRRNERADWKSPLASATLSLDELKKAARDNMRRAPKSLQSKDTSQSRYFCLHKDCEFFHREQHADVNAAINIGRRFLSELCFL